MFLLGISNRWVVMDLEALKEIVLSLREGFKKGELEVRALALRVNGVLLSGASTSRHDSLVFLLREDRGRN